MTVGASSPGPADWIGDEVVPRARPGVVFAELDGEGVLYDEDQARVHALNPAATAVWVCLDGAGTVGEIVADLSEAFDAEPGVVRADVVGLLHELARAGVVDLTHPAEA